MTDLEITKLCAEAMGYGIGLSHSEQPIVYAYTRGAVDTFRYDPLHDDAQAMALVKMFKPMIDTFADGTWLVGSGWKGTVQIESQDLNRAICECVAKMQLAKKS